MYRLYIAPCTGFGATSKVGGGAHNASEASTRAPEEGEGVGGGIPLSRYFDPV